MTTSGYHFYSEFASCRRKWLLHYYFNIVPEWESPPLIYGRVIHSAFEAYYKQKFNADALLETFKAQFSLAYKEYHDKVKYQDDSQRGELTLNYWLNKYHDQDSKHYKILFVEKEFQAKLPNGCLMTGALDLVLKNKESDAVIIRDFKNTSYSIPKMYESCELGDQATCYLWLLNQNHPELKCDIFEPDILYKNRGVTGAERPGQIYRSKASLRRFEQNYAGISNELNSCVEQLESNPKLIDLLFHRCKCEDQKWSCDYADICRQNITPDKIPLGYKRRITE